MSKRYNEKRAKQAEFALNKELDSGYGKSDFEGNAALDVRDAAMGKGEDELFEKKLTKEEKKAKAKAAREAKKKAKEAKNGGKKKDDKKEAEEKKDEDVLASAKDALDAKSSVEAKREAALEKLSQDQIGVTYETKKGALHANTRDIQVQGVTVTFHGKPLIEETEIVINYGTTRTKWLVPNCWGVFTYMLCFIA